MTTSDDPRIISMEISQRVVTHIWREDGKPCLPRKNQLAEYETPSAFQFS